MKPILRASLCFILLSLGSDLFSQITEEFTYVARNGKHSGELTATTRGDTIFISEERRGNARKTLTNEIIVLNSDLMPVSWNISGHGGMGNLKDESLSIEGTQAIWKDGTGKHQIALSEPTIYLDESGSPYSAGMIAQALLQAPNQTLPALPSGKVRIEKIPQTSSQSSDGALTLDCYAIHGWGQDPIYLILDENHRLFSRYDLIRKGHEDDLPAYRMLFDSLHENRDKILQDKYAHQYPKGFRINNVKLFDPRTLSLSEPRSVLVKGERIVSIDTDAPTAPDLMEIDGNGGVLVPGMYDMHVHFRSGGMRKLLSGITSARDLSNNNEQLTKLIKRIEDGEIAGPRITRFGMIEGQSDTNNGGGSGIVVASKEEALKAVDYYAENGYHGVKLYNSMKEEWAADIVAKAHGLGLKVAGHVPAFSSADKMIEAGFDEITHMNQFMLGWVSGPEDDTRTSYRFTGQKKFAGLDLSSAPVQNTMEMMLKNKVAIDPTLVVHENAMMRRDGVIPPGMAFQFDHLPAQLQRGLQSAQMKIEGPEEDKAYRDAFDKILETLRMLKDKGVPIIPGTDMIPGFYYPRELELYQQIGFTPAELLKLATYDMAQYLGHEDRGLIEPGMLADFFLVPEDPTKDITAIKTIALVSKGGAVYFPTEVYPEFGIKPFTEIPERINSKHPKEIKTE